MTHVNDPTVWRCKACGHRYEFGKKIDKEEDGIVITYIVCPECDSPDKVRADSNT